MDPPLPPKSFLLNLEEPETAYRVSNSYNTNLGYNVTGSYRFCQMKRWHKIG